MNYLQMQRNNVVPSMAQLRTFLGSELTLRIEKHSNPLVLFRLRCEAFITSLDNHQRFQRGSSSPYAVCDVHFHLWSCVTAGLRTSRVRTNTVNERGKNTLRFHQIQSIYKNI